MKIWILQTGEPLQIDEPTVRPMRAINLSNELAMRGHKVTVISSDFDHFSKKHRNQYSAKITLSTNLSIKLIPSRGYKNHVGLTRLIDHLQLSSRLVNNLKNLERPDLVFIGFPPIETAWRLSIWLKKRSIPYFVDAKDAWPDIFLKYFSKRTAIIIRSLLLPYSLATKFVFRNARGIIAPSEAYLKWGLDKANRDKSQNDLIAPLSSPEPSPSRKLLREAQQYWKELGITKTSQIKIFFVGSLTDSYDFDPLIQLAKTSKMKVVIAGDGPQKNQLLASATEIKNLVVPGWIDQAKYQVLANLCDFSIIPINNRFHLSSSITNKYVDSLRFGKPILTSDLEIANQYLIPENIGASFSIDNLEDTIIALKSNNKNYNIMRKKARLIYLKNFEFKNVYRVLIELLEQTNSNLR